MVEILTNYGPFFSRSCVGIFIYGALSYTDLFPYGKCNILITCSFITREEQNKPSSAKFSSNSSKAEFGTPGAIQILISQIAFLYMQNH